MQYETALFQCAKEQLVKMPKLSNTNFTLDTIIEIDAIHFVIVSMAYAFDLADDYFGKNYRKYRFTIDEELSLTYEHSNATVRQVVNTFEKMFKQTLSTKCRQQLAFYQNLVAKR